MWEADLKWLNTLKILNLLLREFNTQSLNVILQMLDFASSNDREDVPGFGHYICQSNGSDGFNAMFRCDFCEGFTNTNFVFCLMGNSTWTTAKYFSCIIASFNLSLGLEFASSKNIPSAVKG